MFESFGGEKGFGKEKKRKGKNKGCVGVTNPKLDRLYSLNI